MDVAYKIFGLAPGLAVPYPQHPPLHTLTSSLTNMGGVQPHQTCHASHESRPRETTGSQQNQGLNRNGMGVRPGTGESSWKSRSRALKGSAKMGWGWGSWAAQWQGKGEEDREKKPALEALGSKGSVVHQGQPHRVALDKRLGSNTGTPGFSHPSKTQKTLLLRGRVGSLGHRVCA